MRSRRKQTCVTARFFRDSCCTLRLCAVGARDWKNVRGEATVLAMTRIALHDAEHRRPNLTLRSSEDSPIDRPPFG